MLLDVPTSLQVYIHGKYWRVVEDERVRIPDAEPPAASQHFRQSIHMTSCYISTTTTSFYPLTKKFLVVLRQGNSVILRYTHCSTDTIIIIVHSSWVNTLRYVQKETVVLATICYRESVDNNDRLLSNSKTDLHGM